MGISVPTTPRCRHTGMCGPGEGPSSPLGVSMGSRITPTGPSSTPTGCARGQAFTHSSLSLSLSEGKQLPKLKAKFGSTGRAQPCDLRSLRFRDSVRVLLLNLVETKNSLEKYAHVHMHRILNTVSGEVHGRRGFPGRG